MQRIVDEQDRSKSYLTAYCIFEGIAVGSLKDQPWQKYEGDRINHSFNLGYYNLPILSPRTVKDSDGENKRVLEHNWELGHWDGQRVYDIPFEVSTFQEMMKHAFGSFEDGKIGLSIPTANTVYGVHSIDEFLTDDLPGLIKRKQEPQPTYKFDIDPKALADFMKYQEAMKQQGQNHYG
jgi:hypothetical protein